MQRLTRFFRSASAMFMLGILLSAVVLNAYQGVVKRYGTLLESTNRYQLYLGPSLACESYDHGRGREHWLRASAIFQPAETLPLQADFETFFLSVLLPKLSRAAPAACKVGSVKITNVAVAFYFEGYEPEDGAGVTQGIVANASAFLREGSWAFTSDGYATMAAAEEARIAATERMAAARAGQPYGDALKWVQASTASKSAHPPGTSSSSLIAKDDDLAVYAGDGYSENLCDASSKRPGDFFLNLTLLFSEDAVIPGTSRAEYEEFVERLSRLVEPRCPKANIASIVHYMTGHSHPHYFDQPHINRITLKRNEAGRWQIDVLDTGGPIFVSAADLALYRQAWLVQQHPTLQDNVYPWAFGKLLFAVMAEGVRREATTQDAPLLQLLSTLGRDGLIASALTDLFPEARKEELQYMTRYIGLALSGRLTPEKIAQGTVREYLVQRFEKEDVLAGYAARFTDLLIDLESRKSVD